MREKYFELYLRKNHLAENTVKSYIWAVEHFKSEYGAFSRRNLAAYREFLVQNFKPQTVNLRIIAINKYLSFTGRKKLCIKCVKIQRRHFLDDVISMEEYMILKQSLKQDGRIKWYFIVWFLSATGMRISELVQLKIEHVIRGYADLRCKGDKVRRIFIPAELQKECLEWLCRQKRKEGALFLNRFGNAISGKGISMQLKDYARRCGISEKVVHPHSFRHCFAKNFLDNGGDLAFLADLLGHESIDTTRIYLCRSSAEQRSLIDGVVTW